MAANRSSHSADRIKPSARHTDNAANNQTKGILPVHAIQRMRKRHGERRVEKRTKESRREQKREVK